MKAFASKSEIHVGLILILVGLLLLLSINARPQQTAAPANEARRTVAVRGRVRDAKTGEGLAKTLVSIRQQSLQTVTDANGDFSFPSVAPGEIELYVSTVGYELLKNKLQVDGDRDVEIEIALGQQATKRKESVTVLGGPFESVQSSVVSSNTLDNTELKNLATVVVVVGGCNSGQGLHRT